MKTAIRRTGWLMATSLLLGAMIPATATAFHPWGDYHYSRTGPFTLEIGDGTSSVWKEHLDTTSADWLVDGVLEPSVVDISINRRKCRATTGRVNVCNYRYGNNGWLGLAQIRVNGDHIDWGRVLLNDYYFNQQPYNTDAWRLMVACQEVGHTLSLDHVDTDFWNTNQGTCMDYTNDPDGDLPGNPSNLHPDDEDILQIDANHHNWHANDGGGKPPKGKKGRGKGQGTDKGDWGRRVAVSKGGRTSEHVLKLGGGKRIVTFVVWAKPR